METKTITTPKQKSKVVLKSWITGQEGNEIDKPIMDIKFKINTLGQGSADLNIGEADRQSKEIAIQKVIVSIDGDNKDVVKRVLNMPKTDYNFVMAEINKIVRGEDFTQPAGQKQKDGIE
jgi:hypothetical protein